MFQTKVVEKIKHTYILCSVTFLFSKIVLFTKESEKKYYRAGQAID